MKKFIRSYTDIRGLRKGTVYEVADFGNKILIPYYNKGRKAGSNDQRLLHPPYAGQVPCRSATDAQRRHIRNLVCAPLGTG